MSLLTLVQCKAFSLNESINFFKKNPAQMFSDGVKLQYVIVVCSAGSNISGIRTFYLSFNE